MKGTILFKDTAKKTTKSRVWVTDLAALATLCASLDSYSNAAITGYSVVEEASFAGTTQSGKYDSVEAKLRLTFRFYDGTEKRHTSLSLPAPADAVIEHKEVVGYRALNAQGEALAALLSTASGRTYTYTRGTVLSDPTEAQI